MPRDDIIGRGFFVRWLNELVKSRVIKADKIFMIPAIPGIPSFVTNA